MIYVIIDRDQQTLSVTNGGPEPMIVRWFGGWLFVLEPFGILAGEVRGLEEFMGLK